MPAPCEVHPVTRSVIDPQFADALADGFGVAGVSHRQALDPGLDARPGLKVAETIKPPGEGRCLADGDHVTNVAFWLHLVNAFRGASLGSTGASVPR